MSDIYGVGYQDERVFGVGGASSASASTSSPTTSTAAVTFFLRCQLSSASNGPANVWFPRNPYYYDASDEAYISTFNVLHGADIRHKKQFDGRPRVMRWENIPVSYTNFTNFINYLRSIRLQVRYVNFNSMEPLNSRWPSSTTWKKCRIIDVKADYKEGGILIYNFLELWIKPSI